MFQNCCKRVRYHKLTDTENRYTSFKVFCYLIVLVAILNYISPCDGRGGNIFTIAYAKLTGTYNNTYTPLTEPFTYSIEPFTKTTDKSISMSVTVSSVSKVTCLVAPENMTAESLLYEETASTRFYVRTKRLTNIEFSVNYVLKSNQRLFCKITGLLYDPPHVEYYQSAPFRVFYSDTELTTKKQEDGSFSLTYHPRNIHMSFATTSPLSFNRTLVACSVNELPEFLPMNEQTCSNQMLLCSEVNLPAYLTLQQYEKKRCTCVLYFQRSAQWVRRRQDHIAMV